MSHRLYSWLKQALREIGHLQSVLAVLEWDQETLMPPKGTARRAETTGYLETLVHARTLALNDGYRLADLHRWANKHPESEEAAVIRETWRVYTRATKLPPKFVRELAETRSRGHAAWVAARKANDFKKFLPLLTEIITLKRRETELVGYQHSPYDALLDTFEPELKSQEVSLLFHELRSALVELLQAIRGSKIRLPSPKKLRGHFPEDKQRAFNAWLAERLGFDLTAGRLDVSEHPFTTTFHPEDVRITTRYREDDLLFSMGSTIHEVGHALYEQGLPAEHFGTPLAEAISMGLHESQSRLWENLVGKSRPFWKFLHPHLRRAFPKPFARLSLDEIYQMVNRVEPSLIRTEADEVTYNLHIIVRFEIEKDLIEGTLAPRDLPQAWKKKMKDYLGISVPDDRRGVLQDMHWSAGYFGYFPTYALGNLYASQFFHAAKKDLPGLDRDITRGQFAPLRTWLRTHIHIHGKRHTSASLIARVTGEELSARFFVEHLHKKYAEIYS